MKILTELTDICYNTIYLRKSPTVIVYLIQSFQALQPARAFVI